MSSATIRLFFRPSGTSPRTMRPREPFDDRGLADAGLADEHRVVLRAARQHLDDAADLLVAADHRIELALARQLGEIAAVALERLVGAFGVLARHALRAADARRAPAKIVSRVMPRCFSSCAAGERPVFDGDRDEQVLGADVLVLQPLGFGLRQIGDELAAAATAPAARRRTPTACFASSSRAARADRRRIGVHLPQQVRERCRRAARRARRAGARARPAGCSPARRAAARRATASCAFSVYLLMFMSRSLHRPVSAAPRSARAAPASARFGSWTSTVAYKIAVLAGLPTAGMPWPFSRNTWPFCVVGGTFSRSGLPPSVGTSASPPSTAVVSGTGTRVYRSRPLRSNVGCGARRMRRYRSPDLRAAGAVFAFARDAHARAVADAGGNAHVDRARLAVVRHRQAARRAVIRVLEPELDLLLDVAPGARAAAAAAARAGLHRRRLRPHRRRRTSGRNRRTDARRRTSRASRPRSSCGSRRPGRPP